MAIHSINVRNQFRGRICAIHYGEVLSEVEVETPAGIVTSVVTTRAVIELGLHIGAKTIALFKATEVALTKL